MHGTKCITIEAVIQSISLSRTLGTCSEDLDACIAKSHITLSFHSLYNLLGSWQLLLLLLFLAAECTVAIFD